MHDGREFYAAHKHRMLNIRLIAKYYGGMFLVAVQKPSLVACSQKRGRELYSLAYGIPLSPAISTKVARLKRENR